MQRTYWFLGMLGAVTVALPGACGGKVVLDAPGTTGTGGEGGASTSTNTTVTTSASSGVTATAVTATSSVGQGGGPITECVSCAEYVFNGFGGDLCPDSSALYKEFYYCVCAVNCIPQCGDNVCGEEPGTVPQDCAQCVQTTCPEEFNACANDV